VSSSPRAENRGLSFGPWLWGPRVDLAVFVGSALVALGLAAMGRAAGLSAVPAWAWLVLVLAIDVAHVHATWFRTYLDREEVARHRVRYLGLPALVYLISWSMYRADPALFWRALAYVAVFHFIRQQVGWVALYRAKAGGAPWFERVIDEAAVWASTVYPLLVWHVHASAKGFSWFVSGDFVELSRSSALGPARGLWLSCLALFFARQLWSALSSRRVALGKSLIVAITAVTWYVGIVPNESDFVFTATNVIPHGVPYAWLLYSYTRERSRRAPGWTAGQVVAGGVFGFAAALIACAFFEQLLWDRWAEHEQAWLFGAAPSLSAEALAWLVPLLALPQAMHYVLDGLLWRRAESRARPAQLAALGFASGGVAVPAQCAAKQRLPVQGGSS
jgi:hypothetical protein